VLAVWLCAFIYYATQLVNSTCLLCTKIYVNMENIGRVKTFTSSSRTLHPVDWKCGEILIDSEVRHWEFTARKWWQQKVLVLGKLEKCAWISSIAEVPIQNTNSFEILQTFVQVERKIAFPFKINSFSIADTLRLSRLLCATCRKKH
jgi:hypothetical protein